MIILWKKRTIYTGERINSPEILFFRFERKFSGNI